MKIGILTCGMDAPGMNAVIWAARRAADAAGVELIGFRNGFWGLLDEDMAAVDSNFIDHLFLTGGSALGTTSCTDVEPRNLADTMKTILHDHGIKKLIVCGSKYALSYVDLLSDNDISVIGIPAAIDNDIQYSDYAIGFDTVCNVVVESIMRLRNTIISQKCIAVVEVAGDTCGDIAMTAGMASGVDYILVPEMLEKYDNPFDIDNLFEQIVKAWQGGKNYTIIVVSQGVTDAYKDVRIEELLKEKVKEHNSKIKNCKTENCRISDNVINISLGYMQRGSKPSVQDTRFATEMALMAVNLLQESTKKKLIGITKNQVFNIDYSKAVKSSKQFDLQMYNRVNSVLTSR